MTRAALLVSALLVAACSPRLSVITPAPPNRVVHLDEDADRIDVSEGVAVGVECTRQGLPCKELHATMIDPKIARVYPAHMSRLDWGYHEQGNVSTIALVGLAPGRTTVRVSSEGWTHDYEVDVLPTSPARP